MTMARICNRPGCDWTVPTFDKRWKYCSGTCAAIAAKSQYEPAPAWRQLLPKGAIGKISEMLVIHDLLKRGFHVYQGQTSAVPFKLVAIRSREENQIEIHRVEVTTGFRQGGKVYHHKPKNKAEGCRWHTLAVVVGDSEIVYEPEPPAPYLSD